jgi:multidrug transporter EmrE-like cation transporter
MPVISPSLLVILAILLTALAQVLLKKASFYEIRTFWWLVYFGVSGAMYALSFFLYAVILKHYPLNKIYPAMTVGQIMLVTLFGILLGEMVAGRHALGLVFGAVSIYLILT